MATFAIGDVHGMIGPLRNLLAKAGPVRGKDKVVFVGDLVGRGPASLEVLREVAAMGDMAEVVLGNHDLHLLWLLCTGKRPKDRSLAAVLDAPDSDELCHWLRSRSLAWAPDTGAALVVHAGVWVGWDAQQVLAMAAEARAALAGKSWQDSMAALYGDQHTQWHDALANGPRLQAQVNLLTRMRACFPDGSMDCGYRGLPGEALNPGTVPWFDAPGRLSRKTFIVCGHWSGLGLLVRPDLAMIDCGCCFGNPLAGLWVEDRKLVYAN